MKLTKHGKPETRGGARPGAGNPKKHYRITVEKLLDAVEKDMDMNYEDMLAEMNTSLLNDFREGRNVKEFIQFNENMNKRILANPDNEELTSAITGMSVKELQEKKKALLLKLKEEALNVSYIEKNEIESPTKE